MATKFAFMVSGQAHKITDNTFANVAWLRVIELVTILNRNRKKPDALVGENDDVSFVHFCCHTSKDKKYPAVEIYNHSFAKVRDAPRKAAWTPITDEGSFIEWQPIRDLKNAGSPEHAASIVNVYHSIRRAQPASVIELSIFAHAFVEGPVLTDTDATQGQTTRTAGDTDGRASIDFTDSMGEDPSVDLGTYSSGQPAPTGGKDAIVQVRKAFAAKAMFRIWGCNIQDVVIAIPPPSPANPNPTTPTRCFVLSTPREVIEEAFKRPLKKSGLGGTLLRKVELPPGTTLVHLDMGAQMTFERGLQSDRFAGDGFTPFDEARLLDVHYNAFPDFFKPGDMGGTLEKVIDRSLSDIAKFVTGVMMLSYGFQAAKALPDVIVFTGAPGTSADLSDTVQMHIEPARVGEAKFFAKITGTSLEDDFQLVQRHYTKLDFAAASAIEDINKNGLP